MNIYAFKVLNFWSFTKVFGHFCCASAIDEERQHWAGSGLRNRFCKAQNGCLAKNSFVLSHVVVLLFIAKLRCDFDMFVNIFYSTFQMAKERTCIFDLFCYCFWCFYVWHNTFLFSINFFIVAPLGLARTVALLSFQVSSWCISAFLSSETASIFGNA